MLHFIFRSIIYLVMSSEDARPRGELAVREAHKNKSLKFKLQNPALIFRAKKAGFKLPAIVGKTILTTVLSNQLTCLQFL